MIVIRKCVPRPASNSGGGSSKFYLDAELLVSMDQAGMEELRQFTMNGRDFHLERGDLPKRELDKQQKELEMLRQEVDAQRKYIQRQSVEVERLRDELRAERVSSRVLQQGVVPPPPGSMAAEVRRLMGQYGLDKVAASPPKYELIPDPQRSSWSGEASSNAVEDLQVAIQMAIQMSSAGIGVDYSQLARDFGISLDPPRLSPSGVKEEKVPEKEEKVPARFGSIEIDEEGE